MNPRTRLSSDQKQQSQTEATHQEKAAETREFAAPEELLRHDASHTPVPPKVAARLEQSLANFPPPRPPWWRRVFGS